LLKFKDFDPIVKNAYASCHRLYIKPFIF